ncbi:MAG: class I SAM-dependent methyltransferase [Desulfovibrionaceae bacterium]
MFTFFQEYIKDYRSVGALFASSKSLAKSIMKEIDFSSARTIIEYGAGTGVFTKEILLRKSKDTQFVFIERNKKFFRRLEMLSEGINNVYPIYGDAALVQRYCVDLGFTSVDYIISGLPFASLPRNISVRILSKAAKILAEESASNKGGKFITFQYSQYNNVLFSRFFSSIKKTYTFRNIPPAYVYVCENPIGKYSAMLK